MRPLIVFALVLATLNIWSKDKITQKGWESLSAEDFKIPPVPDEGDETDRHDTEVLQTYQAARTDEQCAEVVAMGHANYKDLFKTGSPLTKDEYQQAKPLMKRVGEVAHEIATTFKNKLDRPRPANELNGIEACHEISEGGASYPSTHSTVVHTLACVLDQIFPDKAAALEAYADRVAELRVIAGLHHPSDIAVGAQLGREICSKIKEDPQFARELRKTK